LLKGHYPTKVRVSEAQFADLKIVHRKICPSGTTLFTGGKQKHPLHELILLQLQTGSSEHSPSLSTLRECPLFQGKVSAKALTLADATVVVPIDFLRLPLIALVGYLVYGETLDPYGLLGAMLMLVGNLVNIRAEHRKKHLV
jgi:hypothetical protein